MSSNKIVLMSSDGESFTVEEVVARQLQIVGHMIDDNCVNNAAIPLQNVTGKILSKVVEYCKKHVDDVVLAEEEESTKDAAKKKLDLEAWDKGFMEDFDMETVFNLILAANYLNVKGLLDLTCQTVADYIKDKTVEEVRGIFNVENDYTPEEEAKVREENAWAFEGI